MKQQTLAEYHETLKAQGVPKEHLAMRCPMCGTIQSANDLIKAGAGKDFDDVERFLGFSCLGRFTHQKPPPNIKDGSQVGCNWTLGGLFRLHKLEVITPDGEKHPRFEPCTPQEAQSHRDSAPNRIVKPEEV